MITTPLCFFIIGCHTYFYCMQFKEHKSEKVIYMAI